MKKIAFTCSIVLFLVIVAFSQSKIALNHNVYESWKKIDRPLISSDGKWVVYEVNSEKKDGYLYLYDITNERKDSFARGNSAMFSPNSDFLVFKISPHKDSIREAKLKKKNKDDLPKDSLGIWVFSSDSIIKFDRIKSFYIAEENSSWVVCQKEKNITIKDTAITKDTTTILDSMVVENKKRKKEGTELIFINPISATHYEFENVKDYIGAKKSCITSFISIVKDSIDSSCVRLFNPKENKISILYEANGLSEKIAIDENGEQTAFIHTTDTSKTKQFKLFYSSRNDKSQQITDTVTKGIPNNWTVSNNGSLYFSPNGLKLFFGTALSPKLEIEDTLLDEEKVKVDIWNWQDNLLQSQQLIALKNEKKRTFKAVYHTDLKAIVQIEDEKVRNAKLILRGNGNVAFGFVDSLYQKQITWESNRFFDVCLIDLITGSKKIILTKQNQYVYPSANGNFIVWFENLDSNWYAYSFSKDKTIALTNIIDFAFYNEKYDMLNFIPPYGIAGWTKYDKSVLIYDRYDLWKIDPLMEKDPVCVTKGFGRGNKIRLRYVRLNKEADFIIENEDILLKGFYEKTKTEAYFKLNINREEIKALKIADKRFFDKPMKAKKSETLLWREGSFKKYPEVSVSDMDFENIKLLSNLNSQQEKYLWGDVELVDWKSFSGDKLQGLLYKPENFDAGKKYPMIVYFYEKFSDNMHLYWTPKPSHSSINVSMYVSNGYVVFIPDISYGEGHPGKDAYNAIVSGTMEIVRRGFVEEENIGLQGQSWGGYQVAYLVTQTDMYKAASAGAPVTNMTSAYGGIRWGSGLCRMFQYEQGQSRIGATLWEKPHLYIENSPLFHADRINTPLLMMSNDKDGSVPWQQGIELFVALRRLNKPAWMLNYNGGTHNLHKWSYRVDFSHRLQQFFDHYLKDEPAPIWLEKGIPAIEKGKTLGY